MTEQLTFSPAEATKSESKETSDAGIFDAKASLQEVLKLPRQDRAAALSEFKVKLQQQKTEFNGLIEFLHEVLTANKFEAIDRDGFEQAIATFQRSLSKQGLGFNQELMQHFHHFVTDVCKQNTNVQFFLDYFHQSGSEAVLRHLFPEKVDLDKFNLAQVEFSATPITLQLVADSDLFEYLRTSDTHYRQHVQTSSRGVNGMKEGVLLNLISRQQTPESFRDTLKHERQHAFDTILRQTLEQVENYLQKGQQNAVHEQLNLIVSLLGEDAKNEIFAYLKQRDLPPSNLKFLLSRLQAHFLGEVDGKPGQYHYWQLENVQQALQKTGGSEAQLQASHLKYQRDITSAIFAVSSALDLLARGEWQQQDFRGFLNQLETVPLRGWLRELGLFYNNKPGAFFSAYRRERNQTSPG